ncbi:MAG: nucleotide exchange factor GrpE [Rhodomicrobium sp.]
MNANRRAPGDGERQADAPAPPAQQDEKQVSAQELEAQIAELKDRVLRELAEQENIRLRTRRERDEAVRFAGAGFAKDIVSSLDNLRRAIESFPKDSESDPALKEVLVGLEATERSLLKAFEKHGIARLDPVGEAFDPSLHDALRMIESSGRPPGTILEVLEPGYLYHERLLRPAKVAVAA